MAVIVFCSWIRITAHM